MRRAALLVVLGALAATPAAGARPAATPQSRLALMPLAKAALGPAALGLPLDPDSGVESNAAAASDAFGDVTGAQLARLGRLTGYRLDYDDRSGAAFAKGRGLLEVETSVELYSAAAAAVKGLAFWRANDEETARASLPGLEIALHPFALGGFGPDTYAFTASLRLKGKPRSYGADVLFRAGDLLAEVTVTAADAAEAKPLAVTLAHSLRARIALAEAGKLAGPPVPLPGKAKAGPPPGGPDLTKLALLPSDLGTGAVKHEGYRLDPDLSPVSDFERELSPAGRLVDLKEEVELFRSPVEAGFSLSGLAAGLSSSSTIRRLWGESLKQAHIASLQMTPVPSFRAGDESRAVLATVKLANGVSFQMGFVIVRTNRTLESLTAIAPPGLRILPSALVQLAQLAAARADRGLGAAPSA